MRHLRVFLQGLFWGCYPVQYILDFGAVNLLLVPDEQVGYLSLPTKFKNCDKHARLVLAVALEMQLWRVSICQYWKQK